MSEAPQVTESDDEKPARPLGGLFGPSSGLGLFRRRRPYDVTPAGVGIYEVSDHLTGEFFGSVIAVEPGVWIYRIDEAMAAAPVEKVHEWNTTSKGSALEAADALWRLSYPRKSLAWLAMRGIVHAYDWTLHLVNVAARVAIIGIAIWFVGAWVGFAWEAREVVHAIALQWLESIRAAG